MTRRVDPLIKILAKSLFANTALSTLMIRLLGYVKSLELCPTRMVRVGGWLPPRKTEPSTSWSGPSLGGREEIGWTENCHLALVYQEYPSLITFVTFLYQVRNAITACRPNHVPFPIFILFSYIEFWECLSSPSILVWKGLGLGYWRHLIVHVLHSVTLLYIKIYT